MTYCISDIHGCYSEFMQLLKDIEFGPDDTLYILGDAIDRGADPLGCLKYVMETRNIIMLMGNHEYMMINTLLNIDEPDCMEHWFGNGGEVTFRQFLSLGDDEKMKILEFLIAIPYFLEVKIGDQNYLLVHAGIDMGRVSEPMLSTADVLADQDPEDLVWIREDFLQQKALPGSTIIFGHTPIFGIDRRCIRKVWRDKKHKDKIGIDGGCVFGGSLLALRLDDMVEYSVP